MTQAPLRVRRIIVWTVLTTALAVTGQHFFSGPLAAQSVGPAMATDHPDYFLGSTVQITGSGFAPNEFVTVRVQRATWWLEGGHPTHEPFVVSADEIGRVSASWVLHDGIGVNFYVWAMGATSGFAAPAEFNRVAVIQTNKRNYRPNETGQLIGAGFSPGAAVSIDIEHGYLLGGPIAADANGRISAAFAIDSDPSAATHRVVAMSPTGDSYLAPMTGFERSGVSVRDDGGSNDVETDGDLLYYRFAFRKDVSPRVLDVTVGWNATWFDGHNYSTIYLDSNSNGRIDLAIDTEIQGEPLEPRKIAAVFACSDTSAFECEVPEYMGDYFWQSWNSVAGGETAQNIPLALHGLGLPSDGDEPTIVNVCSSSDCLVTPGSGFLTIDTQIPAGSGTDTFTYALASGVARNGASSWSITPTVVSQGAIGTLPFISMPPGTYELDELIPAGWTLTDAKCRAAEAAIPTTPLPVLGPATAGLQNVVIHPGQVTRCKFVVERRPTT